MEKGINYRSYPLANTVVDDTSHADRSYHNEMVSFSRVLVKLHTYLLSYWLICKSVSQYAKSLISNEPVIVLKRLTLST